MGVPIEIPSKQPTTADIPEALESAESKNSRQQKQFSFRRYTLRSYPSVRGTQEQAAESPENDSQQAETLMEERVSHEIEETIHRLEIEEDLETLTDVDTRGQEALKQLFCGGVAGSVAKTVTAPFSRLTILFQVHSMVTTKHHRPRFAMTIAGGARKIVERGGIWSLWKGNLTSVLHRFPYSGINFLIYENALDKLVERRNETYGTADNQNSSSSHLNNGHGSISPFLRFMAGAFAGCCACTACYPLDLVRTRLTTELPGHEHYKGIFDAFRKIGQTEGLAGYYSGLGATLFVAIPNFAVSYTAYGTLKEYVLDDDLFYNLRKIDVDSGEERLGFRASLFCGAASGITATVITYPFDTIRRRMQIQNLHVPPAERKNMPNHFKSIVKREGLKGLYRGLTPELIKVIPMVATMFTCYEYLKHKLDV